MALATNYSLPYRVSYQAGSLMSGNQDVRLQITSAGNATDETTNACDAIITPFFLLASSGALSGKNIPPWESTIQNMEKVAGPGRTAEWILRGCNLDEKAIVVLSQMLLMVPASNKIQKVAFSTSATPQKVESLNTDDKSFDPYPGMWREIPFRVNIEGGEITPNFNLRVIFSKHLTDDEYQDVSVELDGWATGLMTGAYGVAPVPPEKCIAFPEDEPILIDNELEWGMSRFLAHPSAINGLLNVCASISHKIAKIDELNLE